VVALRPAPFWLTLRSARAWVALRPALHVPQARSLPEREKFYRAVIRGRWQTDALAGDYHRRTALLQRSIRKEQQRHQHRTHHRKKSENWHWRPFRTARSLRTLIKPGQRSWSSWIKDQAAWHERIILRQARKRKEAAPVATRPSLDTRQKPDRGRSMLPRVPRATPQRVLGFQISVLAVHRWSVLIRQFAVKGAGLSITETASSLGD
jgi:hypothetical protein